MFLPLRLFDRLALESAPAGEVSIEVDSTEVPRDASNLAVRAAALALRELGLPFGLRMRLRKRIPVAAGLGGGSSDAAAALLGVEQLSGRPLGHEVGRRLALELGADVPFFLDPRPAIGRGIGERLEALEGVPEMWWVLVSFPFGVSTAEAYRAAAAELTLPQGGSSIAALFGPSGFLGAASNDLEPIASRWHPEIREARRELERVGASLTGMSGSGPTVYGRFENREAAERESRRVRLPAGARAIVVSSPGSETRDWGWGVAKR